MTAIPITASPSAVAPTHPARDAAPERLPLLAVLTMAAGLGWIGGQYPWPGTSRTDQLLVTGAHLIPLVVVAVAALALLGGRRNPARVALTIVAGCIKATTVVAIVLAVSSPDGFGPHTLLDWIPVGLANAGGGLWLLSEIRAGLAARRRR